MAEITKYVARVPIVPDDFENKDLHKNHELVMDFENDDIYVKKDDAYVNITGQIKEDVKKIVDGSSVIHIVTEQSVPAISDRSENHWYYVITKSKEQGGEQIATTSYIYYGLINTYYASKNYLLIAQNVTTGSDVVPMTILEGYCPCFYIPINYTASFKNYETGENIEYEVEDRVYAMSSSGNNYIAYDVYTLKLYTAGDYKIQIDVAGSNNFFVQFDTNVPSIEGLVLPDTMTVKDGDCIGTITDPTWDNARYIFDGWSTSKYAKTLIDPSSYKPEENITLYAWFTYNDDESLLTYYSTYYSANYPAYSSSDS